MSSPEEQRFTEIYVKHYAHVLGYALRRCDPDDAGDLTAEVFRVPCGACWPVSALLSDGRIDRSGVYGVLRNH
ncbi:MAG: RNA polymerase sigma factor [Acidimicrobiales bacterium]